MMENPDKFLKSIDRFYLSDIERRVLAMLNTAYFFVGNLTDLRICLAHVPQL